MEDLRDDAKHSAASKGKGMAQVLRYSSGAQTLAFRRGGKKLRVRRTEKLTPSRENFDAARRRLLLFFLIVPLQCNV